MKIAILVEFFPPRWLAGTELATYNIASLLAKRGFEIHVITSLDEGLPKRSKEECLCVHRLRLRGIGFLKVIIFWLGILLILKRIKPDIVHVQS